MLVKAYITYVRPILEYNSVVWSPYKIGDIFCIEKVQKSLTKRLPGLNRPNLTYRERLAILVVTVINYLLNSLPIMYVIIFLSDVLLVRGIDSLSILTFLL